MIKRVFAIIIFLAIPAVFSCPNSAFSGQIRVIKIQSAITPTIAEYLRESIVKSSESKDTMMIVELDTPGGLDTAMREIVKEILNSPVPVVVYVHPSGGRAASAGVLITIAANVAAMTPGTNIGAAHPVNVGGGEVSKEMNDKITNDAVAYVKGLAEKRGRNAEWAARSVSESLSIPAEEALKLNVVDILASDLNDLLSQLDGRKIRTSSGEATLFTKGVVIVEEEMGLRLRILGTFSDPNVAYILMMIGIYGLFFELANPGTIFPGVIGAISLIMAFYSFQTIPINYAGVLLILLAIILFVAEAMIVSYGVLAIGGIVSMFIGSLMLFRSPEPYLRASLEVISSLVLVTAILFVAAIYFIVRAQTRKTATGREGMIGLTGEARSRISPAGKVFVSGEYWDARSEEIIEEGERVVVTALEGLILIVKREGK